jgi:phage shock protein PspC (stress-responsive transcriptional regulator)
MSPIVGWRGGIDHGDMTMTDPSDAAPPRSPAQPLTRSREHRMIAGVAGGLGQYLGIDPVVVRVLFVVLAVAGGSGVVLYGLGWLLIPEEGSERSVGAQLQDRVDRPGGLSTLSLLALIACGVLLFSGLRARGRWGFPTGALLVAIAAAVLISRRRTEREPSGDLAPWWVWTIGGVLVTLGIVQLLISWSWGWPILAVLAVGGMVLAAAAGRWLGVGLLLLVLLASGGGAAWQSGVGDRLYRPEATAVGHRGYHLGVGQLTVDLSNVSSSRLTDVNAHVGVGKLTVVVPAGLPVRVHGSASAGDVVIFGDHQRGTRVREDVTAGAPAVMPVRIDATVGMGEVDVQRAVAVSA